MTRLAGAGEAPAEDGDGNDVMELVVQLVTKVAAATANAATSRVREGVARTINLAS